MCRKHYEPFKCKFVPVDNIVLFCKKNRQLMERLLVMDTKYLESLRAKDARRYQWQHWRKEMMFSPEWKMMNALILLQFNWTDSYINTGDAGRRVIRTYKDNRDRIFSNT